MPKGTQLLEEAQIVCPAGHAQLPLTQVPPVGQRPPHLPQLAKSADVSTHAPAQLYETTREAAMAAFAKSWRREAP